LEETTISKLVFAIDHPQPSSFNQQTWVQQARMHASRVWYSNSRIAEYSKFDPKIRGNSEFCNMFHCAWKWKCNR